MKKIEATTALTYEDYKAFYSFSQFRNRHYKKGSLILYITTGALLAISIALSLIPDMPALFWMSGYILTLLSFILVLSQLILPKFRFKSLAYHLKLPQKFKFMNNRMNIDTHAGDSVLDYNDIRRVYETEDVFYIFISKSQAVIIRKKDINQGTPMMLRTRMQHALGKHYKICMPAGAEEA